MSYELKMPSVAQRAATVLASAVFATAMIAAPAMGVVSQAYADPAPTSNTPSAGSQTGSGATELTMILEDVGERGGTVEPPAIPVEPGTGTVDENGDPDENGDFDPNPDYNPDKDDDGLGDNLAFTVPSSINFIVAADGSMTGPSNAFIENRSAFPIHASSLKVLEAEGWNIVEDASSSVAANSVDVQMGPAKALQNLSDFKGTKKGVSGGSAWNMAATDSTVGSGNDALTLSVKGDASHVTKDITSKQKFGEVRWYMTPGALE